jgi:hypothetical protein
MEGLDQLPESLLQLTSKRGKPRNVTVTALSQGGELISTLELNESGFSRDPIELSQVPLGARHQKGVRMPGKPAVLSDRVSRAVSATGELIHAGRVVAAANHSGTIMLLKAGATQGLISTDKESLWHRLPRWPVISVLQAHSSKDSLAEGILIFCLVNVFCCAVMSGIWFIYSARQGKYDGSMEDSEEDEPQVPVPKGDHMYNYNIRQAQDSHIPVSARQQKPAGLGSWSPAIPQPVQSLHPPRQGETPGSSRRHLCPELVVPRGSECVLAVRTLVSARLQQVEFDILDVNGKPVLRVEVSPQFASHSRPWPTQLQRSPTVTLKSLHPRESTGGFVLCYCCNVTKEDEGFGSKRNVYIYKDDDELFAHLMKDEIRKRYVLTSGRLGLQLLFEGNFEEHAVDVSNESRELLAATEPGVMDFDPINKYYKLRVAADVDVGLVLSGLLAIDQMEVP